MTVQRFDRCRTARVVSAIAAAVATVLGPVTRTSASETLGGTNRAASAPIAQSTDASASSPACQAFRNQALSSPEMRDRGLNTDQFVVLKNGARVFDWNDGKIGSDTPRSMWSISKSLTATLVATAIQDGKVKLDDSVSRYLPELMRDEKVDRERFARLKVRDLVSMTSGFEWTESAKEPAEKQSDLKFFYSEGYRDLTRYIAHLPFAAEPGREWNYSSVNATLAMAVLQRAYGAEGNDMPWNNLFRPLGMTSAHFEKDRSGTYVGGAYIDLSARDLAKVGQLFLDDGVKNGKRILPEGWAQDVVQTPIPESTKALHTRDDFKYGGTLSRGGFWLNKAVKGLGKPYPHLPENTLYAAGLLGQTLVVLPQYGLVIARTSHDEPRAEVPVDAIVSNAIKCFAPEKAGETAGRATPLPKKSENAEGFSLLDHVNEFNFMMANGSLAGVLAKELCTCHFVSRISVDECLARSPIPPQAAHAFFDIKTDRQTPSISVRQHLSFVSTEARFNARQPREGCRITHGALEQGLNSAH